MKVPNEKRTYHIYASYDKISGKFGALFFGENNTDALSMLLSKVRRASKEFGLHPEDYDLVKLASFTAHPVDVRLHPSLEQLTSGHEIIN